MKGYKLIYDNGKVYFGSDYCNTKIWGPDWAGKKCKSSGNGVLCGPGWIHFYDDPVVGLMLNPVHDELDLVIDMHSYGFDEKKLSVWECEARGKIYSSDNTKFGTTELTIIKEIDVPKITLTQCVAFGILCVKKVCKNEEWNIWADKWLSGEDRTADSAGPATHKNDDWSTYNIVYDLNECSDSPQTIARAVLALDNGDEELLTYCVAAAATIILKTRFYVKGIPRIADFKPIAREVMKDY